MVTGHETIHTKKLRRRRSHGDRSRDDTQQEIEEEKEPW
jgi:hypothetical protein